MARQLFVMGAIFIGVCMVVAASAAGEHGFNAQRMHSNTNIILCSLVIGVPIKLALLCRTYCWVAAKLYCCRTCPLTPAALLLLFALVADVCAQSGRPAARCCSGASGLRVMPSAVLLTLELICGAHAMQLLLAHGEAGGQDATGLESTKCSR
jgi:hypothetical protein